MYIREYKWMAHASCYINKNGTECVMRVQKYELESDYDVAAT